jgi:hypothetical protein
LTTMAEQAEKNGLEIEQLCERIEELERRVASLEGSAAQGGLAKEEPGAGQPSGTNMLPLTKTQDGGVKPPLQESGTVEDLLGAAPKDKTGTKTVSPGVVPVIGKAVLAMAGAYLLRAVAESGAVPRRIMLVAGIAYAGAWLVWAARTEKRSHFASVIYALMVAAILAPLLWEGTVRFGDLSAGIAAVVLVGYATLSMGLEWEEKAGAIPWIAVVAAVATTAGLIVATHELSALTLGMLALALVAEVVSCWGRWPGIRVVAAVGTVFAVAVIGMVMTSGEGVPASYRAMSSGEIVWICVGIALVFGGSFVVRGFGLKMRWTVPEMVTVVVAVVLATWVSVRATEGGAGEFWGMVFLVMGGVCYWGALKRFSGEWRVPSGGAGILGKERQWNRRVSANFAAGLVLGGSWLLLAGNPRVVLLSAAAVVAVLVFTRTGYLSLEIHGTFYLLAAGVGCGLFGYAGRVLAGTVPAWPEWSFWVVAAAGLASYLVGSRAPGKEWRARVLWVVPAAVVGFAVAAVIVAGLVSVAGSELSASRLSMVRTAVTCVMALGLAYAGSHWRRAELGWLAYGAIGLGALKLVAEDLRFGNAGTLMVSLVFYGAILVLLPKVMRGKAAEADAKHP